MRNPLFALLFAGMISAPAQAQIDSGQFSKLHAELQPDESESWRQIPWKTSVLDAQRTAAAEGKPIFIWAMDGHPLGCV